MCFHTLEGGMSGRCGKNPHFFFLFEGFPKIATKQYLGRLMILEGGGVQNALFKIAVKQCLRLLMMLDFDALF